MSMEYNDSDSIKSEGWNDIKNKIENLYISWATIQSDISAKEGISDEKLNEINKNFDNLLKYSEEKNDVDFIKESVDIYNNIIYIAEKVGYNKNKLQILKVKRKIYESYYNVLEDNWDLAKNNIELANNYLNDIENLEDKVSIIFNNLLDTTSNKDKKIFMVKYADAINELDYISF